MLNRPLIRLLAAGALALLMAGCVAVPAEPYPAYSSTYYGGGGYYGAPSVTVYEQPSVIYSAPLYVPRPAPRRDWRNDDRHPRPGARPPGRGRDAWERPRQDPPPRLAPPRPRPGVEHPNRPPLPRIGGNRPDRPDRPGRGER